MHSQQPPGVVQNWSTLQCSKQNTEQCGYDHAPVTRGRMRAQFPLPHGPTQPQTPIWMECPGEGTPRRLFPPTPELPDIKLATPTPGRKHRRVQSPDPPPPPVCANTVFETHVPCPIPPNPRARRP